MPPELGMIVARGTWPRLSFCVTIMWISIALTGILGVPFVLLWWRLADQWAESERKRFKASTDTRERVVIKDHKSGDAGSELPQE